jgi:D-alanyl-lipoteichoic acid acyltransferase DltB (MBOAT superfamily)
VNIVDFWKKWHITLTGFFTRYVYIPLGGNRKGAARMYLNFMVVFLLSGLWHGNGWNFILWGAMHGVLFVITRAVMRVRKKSGLPDHEAASDNGRYASKSAVIGGIARAAGVLLTFIYVTAAWVLFRTPSIADGAALIGRIFTGGRKAIATQLSASFQLDELWYVIKVTPLMKLDLVWELCLWLFLFVSAAIIFFAPNAPEITNKCKIGLGTTAATAVLLMWSIVSFAGVSTFLYMNF